MYLSSNLLDAAEYGCTDVGDDVTDSSSVELEGSWVLGAELGGATVYCATVLVSDTGDDASDYSLYTSSSC